MEKYSTNFITAILPSHTPKRKLTFWYPNNTNLTCVDPPGGGEHLAVPRRREAHRHVTRLVQRLGRHCPSALQEYNSIELMLTSDLN